MNEKEKIYVYHTSWEQGSDVVRWALYEIEEDMDKNQLLLATNDPTGQKYFAFNLVKNCGKYSVFKNAEQRDKYNRNLRYDDSGFYTDLGVLALKQKDFNYDIDKAFKFAKKEIHYANEINKELLSTVSFDTYKYNEHKKEYELDKDYKNLIRSKSLQNSALNSILNDDKLDTKEKLLEILKDKNYFCGDISKDEKYDFLRDKESLVISEKTFKGMPKELHEIIHYGYLAKEFEDKLVVDDASTSENIEQEEKPIDFSKTNNRVMKM